MPELDDGDTGMKDALYANVATPLHQVVASQLRSQGLQSVHQVVTIQPDWEQTAAFVTSSMNIYQSLIRLSYQLSMHKLSQLPSRK